jgi:hypothetical protein
MGKIVPHLISYTYILFRIFRVWERIFWSNLFESIWKYWKAHTVAAGRPTGGTPATLFWRAVASWVALPPPLDALGARTSTPRSPRASCRWNPPPLGSFSTKHRRSTLKRPSASPRQTFPSHPIFLRPRARAQSPFSSSSPLIRADRSDRRQHHRNWGRHHYHCRLAVSSMLRLFPLFLFSPSLLSLPLRCSRTTPPLMRTTKALPSTTERRARHCITTPHRWQDKKVSSYRRHLAGPSPHSSPVVRIKISSPGRPPAWRQCTVTSRGCGHAVPWAWAAGQPSQLGRSLGLNCWPSKFLLFTFLFEFKDFQKMLQTSKMHIK